MFKLLERFVQWMIFDDSQLDELVELTPAELKTVGGGMTDIGRCS